MKHRGRPAGLYYISRPAGRPAGRIPAILLVRVVVFEVAFWCFERLWSVCSSSHLDSAIEDVASFHSIQVSSKKSPGPLRSGPSCDFWYFPWVYSLRSSKKWPFWGIPRCAVQFQRQLRVTRVASFFMQFFYRFLSCLPPKAVPKQEEKSSVLMS